MALVDLDEAKSYQKCDISKLGKSDITILD